MKTGLAIFLATALLVTFIPFIALGFQPPPAPYEPEPAPLADLLSGTESQSEASQSAQESAQESALADPADPLGLRGIEFDGVFRILDSATGKVAKVSQTDYIRGAIAAEMPSSFHSQAMIAQGIAAQTYALRCQMNQSQNPDPILNGADFSANPGNWEGYVLKDQVFKRYGDQAELVWDKICNAAEVAKNYVLLHAGEPIVAAYHSTSAGSTEDAAMVWGQSVPYLHPVASEGDKLAPNFETVAELSAEEMRNALRNAFPDADLSGDPDDWLTVLTRSDSGYVTEIEVGGVSVHGKELRTALGLRSTNFTFTFDGETFAFTVLGYGHGVGLSQYGADYMARQGSRFDEILCHYYSGALLAELEIS